MIHGLTNGRFCDTKEFWPIYERAQALGQLPIAELRVELPYLVALRPLHLVGGLSAGPQAVNTTQPENGILFDPSNLAIEF